MNNINNTTTFCTDYNVKGLHLRNECAINYIKSKINHHSVGES